VRAGADGQGRGRMSARPPVYLDHQATTPLDPRVLERILPYLSEHFGNPHSLGHAFGWRAESAVAQAREQVAALIGAAPDEIVFTSGATEANNLALKGLAEAYRGRKSHLVTSAVEHKCVLESCRHLARQGATVTVLPVDSRGRVDPGAVAAAIGDDTLAVSIMAAQNEIGTLQPIAEIGAVCAERGVIFHTDAAQAAGKIPLDVAAMGIGLMSLSAHKMYGPKGIGALYVRRRPRVRLVAQMDGGGQEGGLRSGTLSPALCVGFGAACAFAAVEMAEEAARLTGLRDRLHRKLTESLPDVDLNGDAERRLPGNLNIAFGGADGEALVAALGDVALSTGSACSTGSVEPSYVLAALGLDPDRARASVRIGLGRFTTEDDVEYAAERIVAAVRAARDGTAIRAGAAP